MIQIRRITPTDPLYPQEVALRDSVLLKPIGLDVAKLQTLFPGLEDKAEHFVAVFDHPAGPRVVGTALLVPAPATTDGAAAEHAAKTGPSEFGGGGSGGGKLMQMTVDPQRQGEGIGTRLVVAVERRAFAELGLAEMFCHARDTAYGFYSSLGWQFDSDTFMEAGIPHRRMVFRNSVEDPDE